MRNVTPKKWLSQHFLKDKEIIAKFLDAADLIENENVLEIGPGHGAITDALLKKDLSLIAVEKDPILFKELKKKYSSCSNFSLYEADILDFPLEQLPSPIKVVANIPYSITAPLLGKLLTKRDIFSSLTLIVQKELALRMVAKIGSSEMSRFTHFVQYYSHP
ncbi:unnamed protein product, partial [marine sediment metagenome]